MIPHTIHLCWFGRGEYPELAKMCIDSWKKYLPDYDIKLWNEDTFDVNSTAYTKEAYRLKKWAFVSDYVRLVALEKFGGVYMDTDVEVIKDFSGLLENREYVSSTLEGGLITAGFIACIPNHPFIKNLKKEYDKGGFENNDGTISFSMNPLLFTKYAEKLYGFRLGKVPFENNEYTVFPMEYFMPFRKSFFGKDKYSHKKYTIDTNTYCIHHDMGSWGNENQLRKIIRYTARVVLPKSVYLSLKERRYTNILQAENSRI